MTWAIDRWSDKQGSKGISILRNGLAVANMVGQLDDSEMALAKAIVTAMNKPEAGVIVPTTPPVE